MNYKAHFTKKAHKVLRELKKKDRDRTLKALRNMLDYYAGQEHITKPDVKKLRGKYKGILRLRVGEMRVIFKISGKELVVLVMDIVSRGDAYK